MTIFHAVLVLATFLCSLVAGFLFAFAAVVMPGIRSLDDGGFIRAFQVIDRVIQNNQPLFVFVWVGSVLALIAAAVLGIWALSGADRLLIIVAALLYLLCVRLPTVTINIPLNNEVQKLDVGATAWLENYGRHGCDSALGGGQRHEFGIPEAEARRVFACESWTAFTQAIHPRSPHRP